MKDIPSFWDKVEKNLQAKKKWDAGTNDITACATHKACLVKGVKLVRKL